MHPMCLFLRSSPTVSWALEDLCLLVFWAVHGRVLGVTGEVPTPQFLFHWCPRHLWTCSMASSRLSFHLPPRARPELFSARCPSSVHTQLLLLSSWMACGSKGQGCFGHLHICLSPAQCPLGLKAVTAEVTTDILSGKGQLRGVKSWLRPPGLGLPHKVGFLSHSQCVNLSIC